MRALQYRGAAPTPTLSEREYLDLQARIVGKRVQADLPLSLGGYRRGTLIKLTPDLQALVECDGSYGTVWCSLDAITALEEY